MRKFLKPLIVLLASFVFFHFTVSFAEEVNQNATKERREELQKQLDNLDSQIGALDSIIQQKRTESASLERDIAIFDAKIKKAKLEIQRRDAEITKTKTGISQKLEQIITLSDKSEKKKDDLAEYQAEQVQLKAAQERERKKLAANEEEKKNLLKISKGVEKGYQT